MNIVSQDCIPGILLAEYTSYWFDCSKFILFKFIFEILFIIINFK